MRRWFPKIKFVDYINIRKIAGIMYVVEGQYYDKSRLILIQKGRTKQWRTIFHELFHWFIYRLPVSDKRIEQIHVSHDKRSTYVPKWRKGYLHEKLLTRHNQTQLLDRHEAG